jgi:translation initiation factor 2 subunit 3
MLIARSFDVNRPGTEIKKLHGGVIGGSITQGVASEGDELEILPGIKVKDKFVPLKTSVSSISIKDGIIKKASPGGLVGIGTFLDPSLTKGDNLIGNILGKPGTLPPLRNELVIEAKLLQTAADVGKIDPLKINEMIVINSGTSTTVGIVQSLKKNDAKLLLKKPICADAGDKIGLSRKAATRWYLIGHGVVK